MMLHFCRRKLKFHFLCDGGLPSWWNYCGTDLNETILNSGSHFSLHQNHQNGTGFLTSFLMLNDVANNLVAKYRTEMIYGGI